MRILILSCSTGGGHNAAAQALCEAARARGHRACVKDLFGLYSAAAARRAQRVYGSIVNRSPQLFRAAYRLGDAVRAPDRRSPVYGALSLLAGTLAQELARGGYDALAASHLFPAEVLTALRRSGRLPVPVLAVMTDYTCTPFWEETRCDAYTLPHADLVPECTARGLPAGRLFSTGIPVAPALAHPLEKAAARAALGLPQAGPLVLLLSGSMGHGSQDALIDSLLAQPSFAPRLAVICGSNAQRQAALLRRYGALGQVMVRGYETAMPLWLSACDVVVTKPGGLTCTEAAAARVPMVLCNAIPGCESANEAFFVRRGMACAPGSPAQQARAVRLLCGDTPLRRTMARAQAQWIDPQSGEKVCAVLEQLVLREAVS